MASPALDEKPDNDAYTRSMVNAYRHIQKGCTQSGQLPLSEIYAYYQMFEKEMIETKLDFIELIQFMNQPILEQIQDDIEKAKNRKK